MTLSVEELAARVEAIIFDVDGVLTSGSVIYGPGGEWKAFNVQDGHGFKLAQRAGLKIGLLSGRESEVVERRARELGVTVIEQGVKQKGRAFPEMIRKLGVSDERVCYVGDDLVDLPALAQAGFPVAVANAVEEVRKRAAWTTSRCGGEGAAREVVECILKARGLWDRVMERYIKETTQ